MTYNPKGPELNKGQRFATGVRQQEKGTFMNSPAPNRYQVYGDFDFKDPNDPKNTCGKTPKFAFGIKNNIKPSSFDVPGPGTYETDVIPTNQ